MSTSARHAPYVWTTWLTGLLSTEDQCEWAAWFKAHFMFTRLARGSSALTQWKADHGAMVQAVVDELKADSWTVTVEDQNAFVLHGKTGALAGKPDVVAIKGDVARVVDCKSGARRDKDVWQVCVYLLALPRTHAGLGDRRLVGEVRYRDGAVLIQPEEFTVSMRDRIGTLLRQVCGPEPLGRVPSARECQWCDIGRQDCPARVDRDVAPVAAADLF